MNSLCNLKFATFISMICLLSACTANSGGAEPVQRATDVDNDSNLCPSLPSTFTNADLIGTWVARYGLDDSDTLTIRSDGTYRQVYENPDANIRFESDWLDWWVEPRESGFVRVHFEGMRLCSDLEMICKREGGGLDPELFSAVDICEGGAIEMSDEVVLIVTGASEEATRGLLLRHPRIAGSEWTWSFELEGE